jgi:hypothetical protein
MSISEIQARKQRPNLYFPANAGIQVILNRLESRSS